MLREFRGSMDAFAVGRTRMVATSAVRDARNGTAFVEAATAAVGVAPEVLSGSEEGQLAYRGASADLSPFEGDTLVVDIGGGSTEIILGRGGAVTSVSLQTRMRTAHRTVPHQRSTDGPGDCRNADCNWAGARLGRRGDARALAPSSRPGDWWDWPVRSRRWPR